MNAMRRAAVRRLVEFAFADWRSGLYDGAHGSRCRRAGAAPLGLERRDKNFDYRRSSNRICSAFRLAPKTRR